MTLEFLQAVLPGSGAYCLGTLHPTQKYFKNSACFDIGSMVQLAKQYAPHKDVYFALSSFNIDGGVFKRTAVNAKAQRSLWLDLDCDREKALRGEAYASQKDAVLALQGFLSATGLPLPWVVNSGYGYHLYWGFTSDIPTAHWRKMASMLCEICKRYNLIADHHRTRDPASVLRVPGTLNHKYGTTKPVKVEIKGTPNDVLTLARKLIELTGGRTSVITPTAPGGFSFSNSFTEPPKNALPRAVDKMIIKCRQIREMATSAYPAWMLAARTVLHTTAGAGMVHALSQRDKDKYDYSNTQKLIDSLKQRDDVGPGTCDSFATLCPDKCMGCPYRGKIKTPWNLCEPATPKSVTMPAVSIDKTDLTQSEIALGDADASIEVSPFRDEQWAVVPNKGICRIIYDDDGVPQQYLISAIEIYIHTLCIDATLGGVPKRTYIMRKIAPDCAPVDIPFSIEDALGAQKLESWVAQCGMLPHPKHKKAFYEFMSTYISAVQNKLPEVYVRNHFGWENWTDKATGKTYKGFIVGNRMLTEAGVKPIKLDQRASGVAVKLSSRGSLDAWKEVPMLYKTLDQKFAQLLMCAAFGAPLMKLGIGTATNVAYNFWDINGGKGKSSALKAVASVWGDPQQMLMGRTDTHAARFQQYAVYRNLPILIDEITGIHDDDAASMLYDIVNGREKARSTAAGTGLAASGSWDTITIFTANQSMYEMLKDYRAQTSATCMRLIESKCDFKDYTGTTMAPTINSALSAARDNFGLAGPLFIDFLIKNPQVIKAVTDCAEKFAVKYAKSADERFWLYGIAIPLYAGRVAHSIGLLPYDIDQLEVYCINELLPELRSHVKVSAPTGGNLLTDFLNDSLQDTVIVQASTRKIFTKLKADGKTTFTTNPGQIDLYVMQTPIRRLTIRRELDSGTIYVSSTALNTWCKTRGISVDAMLTDLALRGHTPWGIKTVRKVLGKDVDMLPQSTQCVYRFKLNEGGNNEE